MIVDSHCHLNLLDYAALETDLEGVLANAAANQVTRMLCVAIDLESFPDVLDIASAYAHVFASVGVHPNARDCREPDSDELVLLASHPKVIAIGETGLDYFRSEGDLEWQRTRFRQHIDAAKRTGKPLIIHNREARQDTLKVLAEEGARDVGGVMHCFVEDWETARAAMDLNFYISFSGIVTFKNATELKEVAKKMPLDRILVETDSPYLAPVPFRGKTNQPAYTRHVVEHLAELRGESVETIAHASSENFFRLFSSAQAADIE
jgi:TatD DNase family protein